MDENSQKEEFNYGYIHTLASACGYIVHRSERQLDNRGIDLEIIGSELEDADAPRIAIQTKCTTMKYFIERPECFKYDLKVENYNKLIKKSIDPTFLIVLVVPEEIKNWVYIDTSTRETLLKHCAYWVSLQGKPQTINTRTERIDIPKEQVLTEKVLKAIMQEAAENRRRLMNR